jgi:UDP-N-acetylglucosamine--N-acetylmuramyl-(pentapeptide) pyrophosphoryl-undecaprenol N-acetylglucosamine transferase
MTGRPILLAAGGTGGHVFPAEALAAEFAIRERPLVLMTDDRGDRYGGALAEVPVYTVSAGTITGGSPIAKLMGLAKAARGTFQARKILAQLNPTIVIGFGGYPSLPTMLAAGWARIPTLIHEQNAVLGRVNRLLAPRVSAIALSFAATQKLGGSDHTKTQIIGNPVRPEFASTPEYVAPSAGGPIRLLVTGGSQGAGVFSRIVPGAVAALPEALRDRLIITQQCRPEDLSSVGEFYRGLGIHADLSAFFSTLPDRLGEAHLVVARAGASTVSELAVAGRPAVLVPYPYAVDDHQGANAKIVQDLGAGWMMREDAFTQETLAKTLERLLTAPDVLSAAAAKAKSNAQANAVTALADMADRLAIKNGGASSVPGRMVPDVEPAE